MNQLKLNPNKKEVMVADGLLELWGEEIGTLIIDGVQPPLVTRVHIYNKKMESYLEFCGLTSMGAQWCLASSSQDY